MIIVDTQPIICCCGPGGRRLPDRQFYLNYKDRSLEEMRSGKCLPIAADLPRRVTPAQEINYLAKDFFLGFGTLVGCVLRNVWLTCPGHF